MRARNRSKGSMAVFLVLLILSSAAASYANEQEANTRIEKLIELAQLTEEKTEALINVTYLKKTTIDAIIEAELKDELDAIVREFDNVVPNIFGAQERLANGESEEAIALLFQTLEVFGEVNREIDRILAESGVQTVDPVGPQDIIQAMKGDRSIQLPEGCVSQFLRNHIHGTRSTALDDDSIRR